MNNDEKINHLHKLIEDTKIAMLVTHDNEKLQSRPMHTHLDQESGEIWCLTKTSSPKTKEIDVESQINLAYSNLKSQDFVSVSGRALIVRDQAKIDVLWSPFSALWFACEKNDPNVAVIRIFPETAEYWDGKSSTALFGFEIAKAMVNGDKPDLGSNETVRLVG